MIDKNLKKEIDEMSQIEMARAWRFDLYSSSYFSSTQEVFNYFKKKFEEKGGMTPAISKEIGWE